MKDQKKLLQKLSPKALELLAKKAELKRAKASVKTESIPVMERGDGVNQFPLSFAQNRMWFIYKFLPESPAYNMVQAARLKGPLDKPLLKSVVNAILKRHEVLRTTYVDGPDGHPVQQVHPFSEFDLREHDLSDSPMAEETAIDMARRLAREPFNLEKGPVCRFDLLALSETDHLLLVTVHHIGSDGMSQMLFLREVGLLYQSQCDTSLLPPLPIQYGDFAAWQQQHIVGERLATQIDFWKARLDDYSDMVLPLDRPRPNQQSGEGAKLRIEMPEATWQGMLAFCRNHQTTSFSVLMASLFMVFQRYSGQTDLIIGTPFANRTRREIEALIGFFINTLPLRCRLENGVDFALLVRQVQTEIVTIQKHQDLPFEKLVDQLALERDPSKTPIYQVVFNFQKSLPQPKAQDDSLAVEPVNLDTGAGKFDLVFALMESPLGIRGEIQYNPQIFDAETIRDLGKHWFGLTAAGLQQPNRDVTLLPMLDATELAQAALEHLTRDAYPVKHSIVAQFRNQVRQDGSKVALRFEGEGTSYQRLEQHSNRIAHYLRSLGIRPYDRIGLCMDRCPQLIAAILGILKCGATYVPLDPSYPQSRISYIATDAALKCVLTQDHHRHLLPETLVQSLDEDRLAAASCEPIDVSTLDCGAYIIYTSGSTGQPKGVPIQHHNVLRLFLASQAWFQFDHRDTWTLFHSYAFDFSVWEIWGALFHGGRLVIVPYWATRSPRDFYDLLECESVTVLNQSPSAFYQLVAEDVGRDNPKLSLRTVVFGAEALDVKALRPWFERHGDKKPLLVNMYGITETTVHVTYRPVSMADMGKGSPIGLPIPDLDTFVLDKNLNALPAGASGEVFVAGAGLSQGYLKQPALTAQRFVPHPFSKIPGSRLYRSGDGAKRLRDGELVFQGRLDKQVKVRGFRIELGEIQSQLAEHPAILRNVVMARKDLDGQTLLVAYIILKSGETADTTTIRDYLAQTLPDYMIPSRFAFMDKFPMTAHDKLDYRALPEPHEIRKEQTDTYVAPRNQTESLLADIWAQSLGIDRVGVDDNFFALGGDSIRSVRLLSEAQKAGLEFSLQQLFAHQTIARLAAVIDGSDSSSVVAQDNAAFSLISPEVKAALPDDVVDAYPMSKLQLGMIFHMELTPENMMYHNVNSRLFKAVIDRDAFFKAVERVVQRHPILRTGFYLSAYEEPLQVVFREANLPITWVDLRGLDTKSKDQKLMAYIENERVTPFDLEKPTLLRMGMHIFDDDIFRFTITECHAIMDGWSFSRMLYEIFDLYFLIAAGETPQPVPPPQTKYSDFIRAEQLAINATTSARFWHETLMPISAMSLPRSAPAEVPETGLNEIRYHLDAQTTDALEAVASRAAVPFKSVMLAVHLKALSVMSGRLRVMTGLQVNGRSITGDGDQVLGLFLNSMPVVMSLKSGTWLELIQATFAYEKEALNHRHYPYALIQERYPDEELYDSFFNYVHFHDANLGQRAGRIEEIGAPITHEPNHFPLSVGFNRSPYTGRIACLLQSANEEFPRHQLRRMRIVYETLFKAVIEGADNLHVQAMPVDLLPAQAEPTIHFASDFMHRPIVDSTFVTDHQNISCQDLHSRANQVARALGQRGFGPGKRIAVPLLNGVETLVAMLAVLKVGACLRPVKSGSAQALEGVDLFFSEELVALPPAPSVDVPVLESDSLDLSKHDQTPLPVAGHETAPCLEILVPTLGQAYTIHSYSKTGLAIALTALAECLDDSPLYCRYESLAGWESLVGLIKPISVVLSQQSLSDQDLRERLEACQVGQALTSYHSLNKLSAVLSPQTRRICLVPSLATPLPEGVIGLIGYQACGYHIAHVTEQNAFVFKAIKGQMMDHHGQRAMVESFGELHLAPSCQPLGHNNGAYGYATGLVGQHREDGRMVLCDADALRRQFHTANAESSKHRLYWQDFEKAHSQPVVLPMDRDKEPALESAARVLTFQLDASTLDGLNRLATKAECSVQEGVLALFHALLWRLSQPTQVKIGVPVLVKGHSALNAGPVNWLPFSVDVSAETKMVDLIKAIGQKQTELADIASVSCHWDGASAQALFNVFFASQFRLDQPLVTPFLKSSCEGIFTAVDLALFMDSDQPDQLALVYRQDCFSRERAQQIMTYLLELAQSLVKSPDSPIESLAMMSLEDRKKLAAMGAVERDFVDEVCIHELVFAQAQQLTDEIALQWLDSQEVLQRWTYGQLHYRSQILASYLLSIGVKPGDRVMICLPREGELVVAMLAVLAVGATYVPLDPKYPAEHMRYVQKDANAAFCIAAQSLGSDLNLTQINPYHISQQALRPLPKVDPAMMSHVIYTSGSTGQPKGVQVAHRNVFQLFEWAQKTFPEQVWRGVAAVTSVCFDLSVFEIFLPLAAGGCIILAKDALEIGHAALQSQVRLLNTVPSAIDHLLANGALPEKVEIVNLAGEALRRDLVDRLYAQTSVKSVYNLYGPSEDTTYSTWEHVQATDRKEPFIGRPIPGTTTYVLDARLNPVAMGAGGQLGIGGDGLSLGYLNRPGLTAARFVPDPFTTSQPGSRLYLTGDHVRFEADSRLSFHGRLDHQVKLRGFRIELGEIEWHLRQHEIVADAVVVIKTIAAGDPHLVAYVTVNQATAPDGDGHLYNSLRSFLEARLPQHMIPGFFKRMERFPLTPNGKIDRGALPDPERISHDDTYAAPQTPTEKCIADAWCDVLHLERVGRDDHFFELGGHSLQATRIVSRLRKELRLNVPLRSVFEHPTVSLLGRYLDQFRSHLGLSNLEPVARDGGLPLSFAQERMWFLQSIDGEDTTYTIQSLYRIRGSLNVAALEQTIAAMVDRHEMLRTVFVMSEDTPQQVILEKIPTPLRWVDFSMRAPEDAQQAALALTQQEGRQPFDLEKGPLMRVVLVQLGERDYGLIWTMHHIIADGWSLGILGSEWVDLYHHFDSKGIEASCEGVLPPLRLQYADFAVWQRTKLNGEELSRLMNYWKTKLDDAPDLLELPTDKPRAPFQRLRGDLLVFQSEAGLVSGLETIARKSRASLYMVVLTAFKVLLHRYARQNQIVVGSPIANRNHKDLEHMIGMFVNTLALHSDLGGNPSFMGALGRVRETTLDAYAHQDLPFEKLVGELHPHRNMSHAPIFQVFFLFHNQPRSASRAMPELQVEQLPTGANVATFDLNLTLQVNREGVITGRLVYDVDLFEKSSVERLSRHYLRLLKLIGDDPGLQIHAYDLMDEAERQVQLETWNQTRQAYQRQSFPQRFKTALVQYSANPAFSEIQHDSQQGSGLCLLEGPSFKALDEETDRLAQQLIERGVQREMCVPLLAKRGSEFAIAMLAILKAGGVYLPLDPFQPLARLQGILAQSGVQVVMVDRHFRNKARELESLSQVTAWPWHDWPEPSQHRALPNVDPQQLAYILFTSGSTGIPKGVAIAHEHMLNHIDAKIEDLEMDQNDILVQNAPQTFDISVWQYLAALLCGGQTYVFDNEVARDPILLMTATADYGVTLLEMVPSLLRMALEHLGEDKPRLRLRYLVPTGEALPPDLSRFWLKAYPHIPLVNAYGPTECADDVTHFKVRTEPAQDMLAMPIGRPIRNMQMYVVDRYANAVPIGVPGELWVAGDGLGRGYLHNPKQTALAFGPNPFSTEIGQRVYRTGDLVRYQSDGNLVFLGRIDHQVKVRGFRIELGDIEAALLNRPDIAEVVVMARASQDGKDKQLVAYVRSVGNPPEESLLRRDLGEVLPAYMVPAAFVMLDKMPLTSAGKIDRKALPEPDFGPTNKSMTKPQNPLEAQVAAIWGQVLGRDDIDVHEDFFAGGGHSLLATRLIAHLRRELKMSLSLRLIFEHPTVSSFVKAIRYWKDLESASPVVILREVGERPPIFFVHPVGGTVLFYNELAQALGKDQPFYALQSPLLYDDQGPDQIETMASHYLQAIANYLPENGPVVFGGWSFGGMVAYEMARQFKAQHANPIELVLLDSHIPKTQRRKQTETRFLETFLADLGQYYGFLAPSLERHHKKLPDEAMVNLVLGELRASGALPTAITLDDMKRQYHVYRSNLKAGFDYAFPRYEGTITLLAASDKKPKQLKEQHKQWSKLADCDLITVTGNHYSILTYPGLAEVNKMLQETVNNLKR